MKTLEDIIGNGPQFDRNSFQYYLWVKTEKEAAKLLIEERERDRISILEHLELYLQALLTYEDFSREDALSVYTSRDYSISPQNSYSNQVHTQWYTCQFRVQFVPTSKHCQSSSKRS